MKLRTEMQNGCVHANGYCVDEDAVDIRQAERLVHDTAVAHALMMAMRQYETDFPLSAAAPQDVIQWIEKRASEIMAEWGFDTGEDA